ncbi:hypothetical protein K438DRAFT_1978169 [Mycena galopus ATCC 62051]|nr:hypothetical protein K438DRAFT_1978169 [Mycena galopus ATCC 62051]
MSVDNDLSPSAYGRVTDTMDMDSNLSFCDNSGSVESTPDLDGINDWISFEETEEENPKSLADMERELDEMMFDDNERNLWEAFPFHGPGRQYTLAAGMGCNARVGSSVRVTGESNQGDESDAPLFLFDQIIDLVQAFIFDPAAPSAVIHIHLQFQICFMD